MSFRRGLFAVGGIMGVAVLLRYTIVPDEEKILKSMSPELRAEYERNKEKRRAQHDAIMAQILENAKSDKPIWDVKPTLPASVPSTAAGTESGKQ
ncbi:assembly factor cbp4 [Linderina macrospora]|uniref:Assembly factor cbp4 n=1 Tax=Linderina macrospora TaxID=4868 RepID=A0ACC1JA38_9FUNG|nr:assembly factor cbp4 [Linderina macrospora]